MPDRRGPLPADQVGGPRLIPHHYSGPHPAHASPGATLIFPLPLGTAPLPADLSQSLQDSSQTQNGVLPPSSSKRVLGTFLCQAPSAEALLGNSSDTVLAPFKPRSRVGRKYPCKYPPIPQLGGGNRSPGPAQAHPKPTVVPRHSSARSNAKAAAVH